MSALKLGLISPADWGLPVADVRGTAPLPTLGLAPAELEKRIRQNVYTWLPRQWDESSGAFYGYYSAPDRRFEPPQTVNLIAPWLLLAAHDRYGDAWLMSHARRAADWFYAHFVETHPMSVVIGGVRERRPDGDLWTKFTAELVILNLGLYARTGRTEYMDRAHQNASFLIQSARHGFAPKFETRTGRWQPLGWQSFGRVVEACLMLADSTGDPKWLERARAWADYGASLQAEDGGFYLIDGDYFNTDIAADELRAFTFLYERTEHAAYRRAAERFADWLLYRQRADGAWPLTIDRDGNIVVPTVGPGDVPNIGIALLRLHAVTGHPRYLDAAALTFRYALSTQVVGGHPYATDPNALWGFWSWMPHYDFTLSGDQATHHIRGFMFALDYWQHIQHLGGQSRQDG